VRKRERELHAHASLSFFLSLSDLRQHARTLSVPHSVSQSACVIIILMRNKIGCFCKRLLSLEDGHCDFYKRAFFM
jgi:hypothetical protein